SYGPDTYLVTTGTQVSYLQESSGYANDWGQRFRAALTASPGMRKVYSSGSASVFALHFPRGTAAHPPVLNTAGPALPSIVWTPVGLAVLWLLIVVLAAREFIRVCAPASVRLVHLLTLASWPLLVLTLEFVIARFVVL